MTSAAGVPLPGDVAGLVALNALIVHGWDIALATGQPYSPSEEVDAVTSLVVAFDAPRDGNLFGPIVESLTPRQCSIVFSGSPGESTSGVHLFGDRAASPTAGFESPAAGVEMRRWMPSAADLRPGW